MTIAQALSLYFTANGLVLSAFLGLVFISWMFRKLRMPQDARSELKLHYRVSSLIVALLVVLPFLPKNEVLTPVAKVWSATTLQSFNADYDAGQKHEGYVSLRSVPTRMVPTNVLASSFTLSVLFSILAGVFNVVCELRRVRRTLKNSFLLRQVGSVRIQVSEQITVPFSIWFPQRAYVLMPSSLIERPTEFAMAVKHELQHHRNHDTKWVYGFTLFRSLCFLNPALHLWTRWISELQEFACDETLVDQSKVEAQAYARCLVEVAQTVLQQRSHSVSATGLNFVTEGSLLKRRIEKMLSTHSKQNRKGLLWIAGLFMSAVMAATALASNGLVQDRRVTAEKAQEMAERAQKNSGFPIVVNDAVLKQLNRYVGTAEGRAFINASIARMQNHEGMLSEVFEKYNAPAELKAVPIVESGFQNLPENPRPNSLKSAGIWQIIPSTARNFGLIVNDKKDERLDVAVSTDAAMRYLTSNNLRFKDWQLSLLAYNYGEGNLQKGINKTGSRDAWTLIRSGYEGDKDYLAKIMAVVLILSNPDSID